MHAATTEGELRQRLHGLLMRLGESGRVHDDVLGWDPDEWPSESVRDHTGSVYRQHRGLRQSIEFLESQPWLPDSARYLTELVLKAIGRPAVVPLLDRPPRAMDDLVGLTCAAGACPRRRDLPGRLRLARRGMEILTGEWPWGTEWAEPVIPPPSWVDVSLAREPRVVLDYGAAYQVLL